MTKPLITLPCTAQELENSLHAVCDHDGLWYQTVHIVPPHNGHDPYNYTLAIDPIDPKDPNRP